MRFTFGNLSWLYCSRILAAVFVCCFLFSFALPSAASCGTTSIQNLLQDPQETRDKNKKKPEQEEPAKKGKLGEFQAEAMGQDSLRTRTKQELQEEDDSEDSVWFSIFGEIATEVLGQAFVYGGVSSWQRVRGSGYREGIPFTGIRSVGEPLLAFFRLDASYQNVESDVNALNTRAEVGYGPIRCTFPLVTL